MRYILYCILCLFVFDARAAYNTPCCVGQSINVAGVSIANDGIAGYEDFLQGLAPPTQAANSVRWNSPTSVGTAYANIWPSAAPTTGNTFLSCPNGGGQCTWVAGSTFTGGTISAQTTFSLASQSTNNNALIVTTPTSGGSAFLQIAGNGGPQWELIGNGSSATSPTTISLFNLTALGEPWAARYYAGNNGWIETVKAGCLGFSSQTQFPDHDTVPNSCIYQAASGSGILVGNGTPGDLSGTVGAGNFTATVAAPTVAAAQIGYGSTTAAATNCGSLSGAAGCVVINVAGTTHYVPYY